MNLLDAFAIARKHAVRIGLWGFALGLASYLISFLIPPIYQAKGVILPPDDDELSSALSPMRRNLGALSGFGRLGGDYFTQADIALAILRSRSVHQSVVEKFDLKRLYHMKTDESAVRELRNRTAIKLASDGTISVTVTDREPERAADMSNWFLDELDQYNRTFRSFRGRRTRVFLEQRVAEVDSALRHAELALAAYQRQKGNVVVPSEAKGSFDVASGVLAQKMAAEVELELARLYASPQSEEIQRLEARVRELRRQVGNLPAAQVGGAGLLRGVAIQQQVYALLTAQLEEARIREAMDTPTIQVLDRAEPPELRAWPRRSLLAAFGLLLGLVVGFMDARGMLRRPKPES